MCFVCTWLMQHANGEGGWSESPPAQNTQVQSGNRLRNQDSERAPKTPDQRGRYFVPDPNRIDAGIFHVSFALGGNFYTEPQYAQSTGAPTGSYYKDFGFQGAIYFDYNYSELEENVPLSLRGTLGYKYILNTTNVFELSGAARWMFQVSNGASFGIGPGISSAIWYRAVTATSPVEQILFLPCFLLDAGFDFRPFMVDVRWLINRIGINSTITGFEAYFGVTL